MKIRRALKVSLRRRHCLVTWPRRWLQRQWRHFQKICSCESGAKRPAWPAPPCWLRHSRRDPEITRSELVQVTPGSQRNWVSSKHVWTCRRLRTVCICLVSRTGLRRAEQSTSGSVQSDRNELNWTEISAQFSYTLHGLHKSKEMAFNSSRR